MNEVGRISVNRQFGDVVIPGVVGREERAAAYDGSAVYVSPACLLSRYPGDKNVYDNSEAEYKTGKPEGN
jgi:hypothetical protein